MAFNPLESYTQGQKVGQGQQVQRLSSALAGQLSQGKDVRNSTDFQSLMALDPDRANKVLGTFNDLSDERKKAMYDDMVTGRMLVQRGDVNGAVGFFNDRREAVEEIGGDPRDVDFYLSKLESGDVNGFMQSVNQGINAANSMGIGKAIKGSGKAKVGSISPKDFTVDSISKYEQSGSIADLERYSPKIVKVAGVEHQLNPATQKWEPIIDATSGELTEQAKALASIEADKKSRLDFSKSKIEWKTGKPKFRSKIASAKSSQGILKATSDKIKGLVSGWSTEYGASLSALPATDARTLSRLLNTLKAHSAFSTLTDLKNSGGTLGAISEAELVLLESKLGALDQGGDSAELLRVIDQITNANLSSIGRIETEFKNTNEMYDGGFDDFQYSQPKPSVSEMSDEGLFN